MVLKIGSAKPRCWSAPSPLEGPGRILLPFTAGWWGASLTREVPMTLSVVPYSLLWDLVNLEETCISLLLYETSLPRKVLSRSLG